MDVSPAQQFIMNFYDSQVKAGHLISEIDKQDLIPYLEMMVYTTIKDYFKTLADIDASGGGSAGSL